MLLASDLSQSLSVSKTATEVQYYDRWQTELFGFDECWIWICKRTLLKHYNFSVFEVEST